MQGHGHQQIGVVQYFVAGAMHPVTEGPGQMSLIAMLQHQHQPATVPVVAENRARPIPARALAGAIGADRPLAHRVWEWQTAAVCDFLDLDAFGIQIVTMTIAYSFIRFSSP